MFKTSFAQTSQIGGVINTYARVKAIDGNTVTVESDGMSIFSANLPDTVLLIQMTGISQDGTNINSAGRYEFNIVTSVIPDGSGDLTVTLKSPVTPDYYDIQEYIQIIRVPSYKNATTVAELTCLPWNRESGTGGVLALFVDDLFTINHNLDVSGLGFRGGAADDVPYPVFAGNCSNELSHPANSTTAGFKGEGASLALYFDQNSRGWGQAANGGGGGNGKWSGGGGGANGNFGGNGGNQACGSAGSFSGNFGLPVLYDNIDPSRHFFMGGGGGAGTRANNGTGTRGGNGGGIVIIIANRLQFTSNAAIKANGESVDGVARRAGAGGGGAGGSILISANEYDDHNIKIEITGGKGGNVDVEYQCGRLKSEASEGAGGGGSGGLLLTSRNKDTYKEWYENRDMLRLINGNKGEFVNKPATTEDCVEAEAVVTSGEQGIYLGDLKVYLNGFLHNYIFPADTSVCFDATSIIKASEPKVDNADAIGFQWQSSETGYDNWTNMPDKNSMNLTYEFTECIYVRRVVNLGAIADYSLPIKISVYEPVYNEIESMENTVFCGRESIAVVEKSTITGGGEANVYYNVTWQIFDGIEWTDINGATSVNLTTQLPDDDIIRTYRYQRTVISSYSCTSYTKTADITVQPSIKNNIISPASQEICEDSSEQLHGPNPSGGNGYTMAIQWQIKTDGADWTDIDDSKAKELTYRPNPNILHGYGDGSYRRYVESGKCQSMSNEVNVRFYEQPLIPVIITQDKVGDNALIFQFNMVLEAAQPSVGTGTWWSEDEELQFSRRNETTTTVNNLQLGLNTVYWTVSNGQCSSMPVMISIFVDDVLIPTGFSPNGDPYNDCFRIVGGENAVTSELIILDRDNSKVFESKSFNTGSGNLDDCTGWWDGNSSSGKELPAGTYFYQLTLNGNKIYKGYVVLKR